MELAGFGARRALLFLHELREHGASPGQIAAGIVLTFVGMIGASSANVLQARPEVRRFPLFGLLAWSMAAGAVIDTGVALPSRARRSFDPRPAYWAGLLYLALLASVLNFSIYYPVVRKHRAGQGRLFERAGADHRDGIFHLAGELSLDAG